MRILLDNGIVSSSDFLIYEPQEREARWGELPIRSTIAAFRRVAADRDADQQHEKDAIFTVGRLARQGQIALHTYEELQFEDWRGSRGRNPVATALRHCPIQGCRPPIDRSKFRRTTNFTDFWSKWGKHDRGKGLPFSDFSQVSFFQWIALLSPEEVLLLLSHSEDLALNPFEVGSLHDLPWFQSISRAMVSPDHLPDCFHLWTARRNELDAFLTLEKRLPRRINQLRNEKQTAVDIDVAVLRPTGLLRLLDIAAIDPVPIQHGRLYSYLEVLDIDSKMRQELHQ